MEIGFWVTPLLLLPGVALLVLSTSIRYGRIHDEVHDVLGRQPDSPREVLTRLAKRATLFRNALVSLYLTVACLALASLGGAVATLWVAESYWFVLVLTAVGIACLLYGSTQLVRESRLSLDVIRDHIERMV